MKRALILSLFAGVFALSLLAPSAHAQEITPPPSETPTATPWVVLLVTPTPNRTPPSMQIPELASLIAIGNRAAYDDAPPIPLVVDERIDMLLEWLTMRQLEYRDMTGRYCQLLSSHTNIPADGVHEYPDRWYLNPTDQQYDWDAIRVLNYEPLPFAVLVNTYNGREGYGFVAVFKISIGGVVWVREVNYGPESDRNLGWYPLVEALP